MSHQLFTMPHPRIIARGTGLAALGMSIALATASAIQLPIPDVGPPGSPSASKPAALLPAAPSMTLKPGLTPQTRTIPTHTAAKPASQPVAMPAIATTSAKAPTKVASTQPIKNTATAATSQNVSLTAPATVKQGQVAFIQLKSSTLPEKATVKVSLAGKTVPAFRQKGYWQAVMPVTIDKKLGGYTLMAMANGQTVAQQKLEIVNGGYSKQNISVTSELKGLQPEPGELDTIARLKNTTTSAAQWWAPQWQKPVPECMNSPFGNLRYHNDKFTGNFHKGVDQRSPQGRIVMAPTAGKVAIARTFRLHGGTVGLDHGQGVSSIYIHLAKINVKPGDMVKAGQPIGEVGSTGFATGPHLHWGVYAQGEPVDPRQWVSLIACQ